MNAPANCQLIRRWRIVEADIWDRDHLATVRAGDHHHRRQSADFFNGLLGRGQSLNEVALLNSLPVLASRTADENKQASG